MNRKIIEKVSKNTGYDLATVDFVQRAMWKFLRGLMESGNFEGLMLPGFGKFIVKEKNREKYKDLSITLKSTKADSDNKRILELDIQNKKDRSNLEEEAGTMQDMSI